MEDEGKERSDILAHMLLCEEELCSQVFLSDHFVVEDSQRSDAGQHEVLGDLVGQCSDGDKQDVGRPQPGGSCQPRVSFFGQYLARMRLLLLRLDSPQPDLPVVERDLI